MYLSIFFPTWGNIYLTSKFSVFQRLDFKNWLFRPLLVRTRPIVYYEIIRACVLSLSHSSLFFYRASVYLVRFFALRKYPFYPVGDIEKQRKRPYSTQCCSPFYEVGVQTRLKLNNCTFPVTLLPDDYLNIIVFQMVCLKERREDGRKKILIFYECGGTSVASTDLVLPYSAPFFFTKKKRTTYVLLYTVLLFVLFI